jgi:cyanophycin synthetase
MYRANRRDLVVLCVDKHATVLNELENWSKQAQAGSGTDDQVGDPDLAPIPLPFA